MRVVNAISSAVVHTSSSLRTLAELPTEALSSSLRGLSTKSRDSTGFSVSCSVVSYLNGVSPIDQWLRDHALSGQSFRALCDALANDLSLRSSYVSALKTEMRRIPRTGSGELSPECLERYTKRIGLGVHASADEVFPYSRGAMLGQGGFGQVFSCHGLPEEFSEDFVVKFWNARDKRRSPLAVRLAEWSALMYLNQVPVLANPFSQTPWLMMPKVEGRSLWDILTLWTDSKNKECFPDGWKYDLFYKLLEELKGFHARGLHHLDIKPDNIMVTPNLGVRCFDFGCADFPLFPHGSIEISDQFRGTLEYMSPKRVVRNDDLSPSDDCFSAGVTFFHMLTNGRLRRIPDDQHVQYALNWSESDVARLLKTTHKLDNDLVLPFLSQALHPDEKRRFSTIQEMQDVLKEICADVPLLDPNKYTELSALLARQRPKVHQVWHE